MFYSYSFKKIVNFLEREKRTEWTPVYDTEWAPKAPFGLPYIQLFFNQNSVFLSQQFSQNSVFSQFQSKFCQPNECLALDFLNFCFYEFLLKFTNINLLEDSNLFYISMNSFGSLNFQEVELFAWLVPWKLFMNDLRFECGLWIGWTRSLNISSISIES